MEIDNPAYNVGRAVYLQGPLKLHFLQQSLDEIVRRHESLRTNFAMVEGQPAQVIARERSVPLPILDLRSIQVGEHSALAKDLVNEEARRPFDLERDQLLRAKLLWLAEQEFVLVLTMHHIVSDGWSLRVLFRELSTLYTAFSRGDEPPLSELPLQYADFALWQREWLQGETLESLLAYWRKQLVGSPLALELPSDRPRPALQTHRGAGEELLLEKPVTQALKALCTQENVTLYMLLLAAFGVLLHRYTGQDDILIGSPISGRDHFEIEGLIGYFLNTLVLRLRPTHDQSFRQFLQQMRETVLAAYAHQVIPFEVLLQKLQIERSLSHAPLFQAMFVLHDAVPPILQLPDVQADWLEINRGGAMFDLTLVARDVDQGLSLTLRYSTDLFDAATIRQMLRHLQILLESILAGPELPIWQLPLLPATERQQVLVDWNQTRVEHPKDICVQDLFEAQVERTPDAVAVVHKDQKLTYAQLDRRANQLAHYLQAHGIGPDSLIGLCMGRSLEMIVGLLGVLKAGGAYVPLDPTLPQHRLALMLEETEVPVLLTQQHLRAMLPGIEGELLSLDSDWDRVSAESHEKPDRTVHSNNLAYVIFTSGSTGRPKGVMIRHSSLANYTATARDVFALTPTDRVLQFASISFDTAAEEIFPCLVSGAGLVLRSDRMLRSVPFFFDTCIEWGVTVLDLPTVYWHEVVEWLGKGSFTFPPSVRLVIIGGDKARRSKLAKWHEHLGQETRLLNTYGPTEATVVASFADLSCAPDTGSLGREVSIGRPIDNCQTYILDSYMQPVPVGAYGELCIGGYGLARGYLNMPGATAGRFVANPFAARPGTRLYRTGDLARYRRDGTIEFSGRLDHQVKIRGFRIELSEIEAVLGEHQGVREVVLVMKRLADGDERLVAYVVPERGQLPSPGDLRRFLQVRLPDHMIPATFAMLEELPLTPSGKVDRRALPEPNWNTYELAHSYEAPGTAVEEVLAGIFGEILKINRVGLHDSFFELGGHSLLAIRVLTRVQDTLRIEIPLLTIFETPTVAGLSQFIQYQEESPGQTERIAQLLQDVRAMSAEEVTRVLQERKEAGDPA
jgi:amino acid adenylation domain-containing protein